MASTGVPIIDLQDLSGCLAERLVNACEEWGCFRIVNHGIPLTLMSEMKMVSQSLLGLPMEVKERNKNSHPQYGKGYTPPNMASPYFESLGIYDIPSLEAIDLLCAQIGVSPHQREIIRKYSVALHNLALDLGRKLMEGLRLPTAANGIFKGWSCQIKMNKYNYSHESVGLTGALLHSDPGFLTILQDDETVNGLEVVKEKTGELVPVNPVPGTLVVNVGDVAKVWTNGRFCNVKHQVQCYEPKVRLSFVLFVLAPQDKKVEAPPELVDSDHPRLYIPFDFEEYRKLRSSTRSPTGGALDLFRTTIETP